VFALDTTLGTLALGGCCTPDGGCGLSLSRVALQTDGEPSSFDLSLGCFGLAELPAPIDDRGTEAEPLDDCVTGYPSTARGCGEGTPAGFPVTCISNVAASLVGCTSNLT
jgi:hypothetical protein